MKEMKIRGVSVIVVPTGVIGVPRGVVWNRLLNGKSIGIRVMEG